MLNLRKVTAMANYELSNQSLDDLKEIWRYGTERRGLKQADHYPLKIDEICEFIIENGGLGRGKSEVFTSLKVALLAFIVSSSLSSTPYFCYSYSSSKYEL